MTFQQEFKEILYLDCYQVLAYPLEQRNRYLFKGGMGSVNLLSFILACNRLRIS
ncbi:hypothetical protein SAMN05216323_10237 [Williamwhitmania taraxaci]|uniref:Uncharacterized protein n=1 Tax=Williamwhitmania taraxaci TaxID=1640674 RepID=A0A1G6K5E5_9BACT|nr:hypothetical protein SAMN05216323_10237 [Williamwhitmania taraxaci]